MSYTLLLDCSDVNLTIGISRDDELIYQNSFYAWQRQSEYTIPEIVKACESLSIGLKDISYIALGIGPGSYTGVRIPLAISKTLAVITKAKIIPLSSLMIMGKTDEKYIALMNARGSRSYIGIYENGKKVIDDQIIENDKLFDFIDEYLEKGFVLRGELSYLKIDNYQKPSLIDGLFSYSKIIDFVEEYDSLKPIYLKD